MRKALFLLYLFLLTVSGAFAQGSYPIFVSPTLTPPYSLKLSDYCKFGSQQLIVNITVNDLNISNLPVKLHIKLETVGVTIETPPTINTTPIYLDGGATSILFGDDLKDYFDIDNLIFKGYSKEAYKRTGQLPEGFYKITIDILHFQTNRLISNQGSVTAWISLGKPPTLKLPENGKEIGEFKGMPLTFSWLPSNVGSPVSANSIQYKFEVWEMRVDGISPYTMAATVPVFYEETTQNTMISLFPSTLLMERGMKYAWRITASDLNGIVPFEQDGHSEIRVFTYKSKCNPVKNLAAVQRGQNGSFTWKPASNHTSYNVELRKPLTGWLSASQTFDSKAEFFDLDYGTTYEMRVQAVCDDDPETVSDFSEWKKLEIPVQRTKPDSASCPNCGCGANLGAGTIANLELKKDLKPGDTLTNRFGTTRFIVKSVEPQGDGIYKGHFLFWAEIWKLKFICEYWDLSVNTDNVILNMDFQSVYNPQFLLDVDATTAYLDNLAGAINELTVNTTIKDTISVTETITSIYVNAGDSIIAVTVGADGELHEVVIQPDAENIEQTLITGTNGEEFVVTRDGEIMGLKEYKNTGGGNGRKMDDYIKDKETNHLSSTTQVSFTASPNQKYGFDAFSSEKQSLVTQYPSLKNGYTPSFKSIASYSTDKVLPSTTEKGITFRDEMGIPAIVAGNDLTVRGSADGSTTALYAYKALTDTTEEIAGKLNLISFDEQTKKLYIVPVNNAHTPDAIELQNVLNKVYSQALTRWEVVKIDKSVDIPFENGQMVHGGSSAISVYNTDQKNIISKFKENDNFEKDALYLFFVDNVKGKTGDVAGFMPLQRQAGFIYDSPNLFIVAHELAHGTFNLRHTFSPEDFIAAERTTKNLMDYSGNTELWKNQWALIHDPESMLFAWAQDESEGQYAWTFLNKKYTLLFNHIYDNNHIGNLAYSAEIEKNTALEKFNLKYITDEEKNWSSEEKKWIDVWKIGTYSGDNVSNSIIKKIQNAGKGSTIESINLAARRVYIGKFNLEGTDYPVAIYSSNGAIEDLKKIQVTNLGDLTNDENKNHIYCDETFTKYFMLALFSEKGDTLIMQVEKFVGKDTEEKWLEFLSIVKPDNRTEMQGLITLFEGDEEIKEPNKFFAKIDETPKMPDNLKLKFNGESNETADVTIEIKYRINYEYNGEKYLFDDGVTTFKLKDVAGGKDYPLSFDKIRGGTVTITCETKDRKGKVVFHIRGLNPSRSQVKSYQITKGFNNYWFLGAMTNHESSFMQFCYANNKSNSLSKLPIDEKKTYVGPFVSPEGQEGLPLYGGPHGFGLKQLDNWTSNGVSKKCSAEQRWDWHANIDGGLEVIATKIEALIKDYSIWKDDVETWNKSKSDNKISMDDYVFGGDDNKETFSYSDSPIFPELNFTGNSPTSGKYSFLDAILISKYNGGLYLLQLVKPDSKNNDNENVDLKPYWILKSTYTYNGKTYDNTIYINDICNNN